MIVKKGNENIKESNNKLNYSETERKAFVNRVMEQLNKPESWEQFHEQVQKYMSEGVTKEEACEWAMIDT